MDKLKYPIGRYQYPGQADRNQVNAWIDEIATLTRRLRQAVSGLTDTQLDTPYRHGGWTVRQVIHHLCDSHMNSLIRFKLAVTEDTPSIKPYDEAAWAELADYRELPVAEALTFLDILHKRLVSVLRSLTDAQLDRTFYHPEAGKPFSLRENIGLYAWHGNHHLAHITRLMERQGW